MEKKIEITNALYLSGLNQNGHNWHCEITVDGINVFTSYGHTRDAAESNARIEAKGYLVEEMVEMLTEAKIQIEYLHDKFTKNGSGTGSGMAVLSQIESLLTKAETFNT